MTLSITAHDSMTTLQSFVLLFVTSADVQTSPAAPNSTQSRTLNWVLLLPVTD